MLVSVVIPTFNSADYLVQAIQSVLAQTYHEFEIIVVDDASTDNTEELLRPFADRICYVRQDRGGPSVARNRGILQARGELIAFLDADDLWRPTKLARQVEYLKCHPEACLVYTDFTRGPRPGSNNESRLRDFKTRVAGAERREAPDSDCSAGASKAQPRPPFSVDVFHGLLEENFIATPTVMVRRSALARSGLFDPTLRGSEDLDLWLRLAGEPGAWHAPRLCEGRAEVAMTPRPSKTQGVPPVSDRRFGFIDEILVDVRQHEANTSRTVDFIHEQIRAARIMLARWGDDPAAARLIRRRLGICSWNLAFAEQTRGRYSQARSAYWSSACHTFAARPTPMSLFLNWKAHENLPPFAGAIARAAFMSLPPSVLSLARQWMRSLGQGPGLKRAPLSRRG